MNIGVVSIQKNRGRWLTEWFAFHYLVGVRKFYFYAHQCTDNTHEVLLSLSKKLDIKALVVNNQMDRVQLMAYQHACENYMDEVDWMAFIDGDEFLFSPSHDTLSDALQKYVDMPISAIGVYNITFGSNSHLVEPDGNIVENYRRCCLGSHFSGNRRVKSIVKGRQTISVTGCGNVFNTPLGTVDELLRPVSWGYVPEYEPSYIDFRFNHYVCQSYEYFKNFKSTSGHADASSSAGRGEEWWTGFDRNEDLDDSLERFYEKLRITIDWLNS